MGLNFTTLKNKFIWNYFLWKSEMQIDFSYQNSVNYIKTLFARAVDEFWKLHLFF